MVSDMRIITVHTFSIMATARLLRIFLQSIEYVLMYISLLYLKKTANICVTRRRSDN